MNTTNKSWKSSLAGALTGASGLLYFIIDAIEKGQFTGKTGVGLAASIGIAALGYFSKDSDKTGLPTTK